MFGEKLGGLEKSGKRWREIIQWLGGGELCQVEGSSLRWRRVVSGGGERSQVEKSGLRKRGAVSDREKAESGELSQVEGSGFRRRELSQEEGSCLRWRHRRGASGGGER